MSRPPHPPGSDRSAPWVTLRSTSPHPFAYRKMVGDVDPAARPGDVVAVYDRHGRHLGWGLYNPRSMIVVRILSRAPAPLDDAFWRAALSRAVRLRRDALQLDRVCDAYRVVHAEGDGLSGLVVDRFGDTLSVSVQSLGIWQRLPLLLPILHELLGTRHHFASGASAVQRPEGLPAEAISSPHLPREIKISEHGVRYAVQPDIGHKTGFFCDQRDNRARLAEWARGTQVLDMCSFSGGFGLAALVRGGAQHATCVDLDEKAVELIKRNANLNSVRVDAVQADAFTYMRQMHTLGRRFDVVALDPPKLIFSRRELDEGRRKYADLNRLAAGLVQDGGLLVTCSCSGSLSLEPFRQVALTAVHQAERRCQILAETGAAPDHPIAPECPESAYLKVLWLRILDPD